MLIGTTLISPNTKSEYDKNAVFIGITKLVSCLVSLLAGLRKNHSIDFHKVRWEGGAWATKQTISRYEYNARYIHSMFIYLQPNRIHTPLVLHCPHSQRTLRTSVRKLHTLMRKCLLLPILRPASPRPLRRAIPRQSLACPGDVTSSPSPWLQLQLCRISSLGGGMRSTDCHSSCICGIMNKRSK